MQRCSELDVCTQIDIDRYRYIYIDVDMTILSLQVLT